LLIVVIRIKGRIYWKRKNGSLGVRYMGVKG